MGESTSRTAFLFAGHGSQYEGMGEELFEAQPVFREALERCDAVLADEMKPGLLDILYGPPETRSLVDRTEYGNPVFCALEWALARLWLSWGVTPAYVIGHSVGEYAAACVAGVFRMEDCLKLSARLGKLLQSLPPGDGMLAVGASRQRVSDIVGSDHPGACLAAVNGPTSVVLAAEGAEIDGLRARFEEEGVRTSLLRVSRAYHSPTMNPIFDDLRALTRSVRFSPPSIPYVSSFTGRVAHDELRDGEYWVRLLANPVLFLDGMRALFAEKPTHLIEIGPASTVLRMGQQCVPHGQRRSVKWIPSIGPDGSDSATMAAGLATVNGQGTGTDTVRPPLEAAPPSSAGTIASVRKCVAGLTRMPEDEVQIHQPFGDYGMDSLMAAEFIETIERETTVRLPASLMAGDPTVAETSACIDAQLASNRDEAPPADCPRLVRFREGGTRLPLHFVPAGDGDLFAFRNVVERLGADQPVFGLEPPRAMTPRISVDTTPVGWLAARYVDEIEKEQPRGPYRLAGYSVGGIIAVEMGRELIKRGREVDLLLLLDCPSHVPFWVGALHTVLRRSCDLLRLLAMARRQGGRRLRRVLHAVMDQGLRTHVAVSRSSEVQPYAGPITCFRARRSWIRALDLVTVGKSWRRIALGGLEVRKVAGTHFGMFRGRHLDAFAAALAECLAPDGSETGAPAGIGVPRGRSTGR